MDDLISRQAAITEFSCCDLTPDGGIDVNYAIEFLKQLPSAQPERPEQPESAKEYCAECDHIEMCQWYPYEGCEFRSLPSAERRWKWIPVTERLPEEGVPVLATFKGQGGNFCLTTSRLILDGYERWSAACGLSPIAWMPSPTPYKGGEEE